ncbi:leukotriene B4 receptor 1-like isoform X2 [Hyla sarda]|nr:leukotriene B4 receptor 1-like isoform X2 [Hyla sarda]XP_056384118.1 leukotriene B4 receptor 1-like isoform X2 [Hyla sarda]XP_056384120.1 leukotriene B4 receptor 1-like isoform X2 [Hyla sarda]XP_056384125.1 leukotriene B4 receptor 1-like isoform X2 [Hyla sarda]
MTPTNVTKELATGSIVGISILSLAFIIGIPGNAFVIWTVLACMKKKTVACALILHLAIADFFVILTAPLFIHFLATGSWTFGTIICKLCHYVSCLSMYASILLITSMSIDRFLAVSQPFSFLAMRTKYIYNIVFVIWLLASLLAIPMPFYREMLHYENKLLCIPYHSSTGHAIFQYLFEFITGFVFPFSIIISCYVYIGLRLRTAKFKTKPRTSRLVIMIVVTFALFWLPYQVVNILQVSGQLFSSDKLIKAAKDARPNATAFAFISSSVNPIIYVFAGSNFIKTAGAEFMAKLFEGVGSDSNTLHKVPHIFWQKSQDESAEVVYVNK